MIALLFLILLPFLCRLPEDLALASTWPRDSPGPRDVGGWTASELRAQTARSIASFHPPFLCFQSPRDKNTLLAVGPALSVWMSE